MTEILHSGLTAVDANEVIVTEPVSPRALKAEKLKKLLEDENIAVTAISDEETAFDRALSSGADVMLFLGSIYLIGDIRIFFNRKDGKLMFVQKWTNDDSRYNLENIAEIAKTSPTVAALVEKEYNRQKNNVELIASENYCSEAVLAACGSCLSWKYAEGYPAKPVDRHSGNKGRYYGGTRYVDELEEYCCDKWREVFNTDYHVNVQPHSGSQANFAAYNAVLEPGDTILSLNLDNGGHLTHGSSVNFSGKFFDVHFYNVDDNGFIDMEDLEKKAKELQPKLILTGASAYSRIIDFEKFAEIAKSVDALFMVDMAHIAGLRCWWSTSIPIWIC